MEKTDKFARGYSFYKYFLIFIIGCVFGFIYETIIAFFKTGELVGKQELIYGPFMPVYGIGAVLFMYVISKNKGYVKTFFICSALGGILEYFYSFFQELFFGTISWDYSQSFANVDGRTTLIYAIFWGALGLLFKAFLYPFLSNLIEKAPKKIAVPITWALIIFIIFDINITIFSSLRQNERNKNIPPKNAIDTFYDTYYPDEVLNKVYTNRRRT